MSVLCSQLFSAKSVVAGSRRKDKLTENIYIKSVSTSIGPFSVTLYRYTHTSTNVIISMIKVSRVTSSVQVKLRRYT